MSIRALCVGHAAYDLCAVVEGYPAENSKAQTEDLVEAGGGPAANAAWLLARWGVPTALAALVGTDDYGERVVAELRRGRVNCRLVERRAGQPTPVSLIVVNRANGSRTIINRRRPAGTLEAGPAFPRTWKPRLLLFDGHELPASLAALQAFPKAITVLDAGSLREGTRVLAGRVDYLVCSERFAMDLTGQADWRGAGWEVGLEKLRAVNCRTVVVTLGEQGSVFAADERRGRVPALPVKTVDTTAAGDIFHGAFAYGLLQGHDLTAVLKLATAAAGLSVQRFGGRPSVPELAEVKAVLSH